MVTSHTTTTTTTNLKNRIYFFFNFSLYILIIWKIKTKKKVFSCARINSKINLYVYFIRLNYRIYKYKYTSALLASQVRRKWKKFGVKTYSTRGFSKFKYCIIEYSVFDTNVGKNPLLTCIALVVLVKVFQRRQKNTLN
jgi:hypothetical protein